MDYAKESLKMHYELRGKLEVTSRAAVDTKDALSLAYTPGVAAPCLEIQKDVNKSYELTRRWNTVAVVTDGTAVLGLGDIGPEAAMPVNAFLHASYFTLRSGGKTIITFLFDSVFIWVVSVPVAFCLSRFTGLSIYAIYFMVMSVDLIKCVIGFVLVKKGVWLQNIVAE